MNMMTSEMATLTKQHSIITELLGDIKQLKWQNMEQEKKIVFLENRVSDLEQYSQMNDVIISGLVIRPRNYLQAVKGTRSESGAEHEETTEEQTGQCSTALLHRSATAARWTCWTHRPAAWARDSVHSPSARTLDRHMKTHIGKKPFNGPQCNCASVSPVPCCTPTYQSARQVKTEDDAMHRDPRERTVIISGAANDEEEA
ncbi:hypothetical protein AAFF_G00344500 [Aldrovandia affinis]|uniref:Uncharacterized protein n=1 Tax=Aldrovandia affinis TaxID=143900 RepID=A0AAD7WPC9_9TELE|nr:hypothetical protein AAFF_G00344500 [Aldrovandia affinis]